MFLSVDVINDVINDARETEAGNRNDAERLSAKTIGIFRFMKDIAGAIFDNIGFKTGGANMLNRKINITVVGLGFGGAFCLTVGEGFPLPLYEKTICYLQFSQISGGETPPLQWIDSAR